MHIKKIEFLGSKILYKGWSVLEEYKLSYTRQDGSKDNQIREIYDSGDGAAVLLYNTQSRKIILIRQFRLAALLNGHPDGFIIECCAGMLDQQEPEVVIIREIEEETGYKVTSVNKIYEAFATPGAHKEKIHFYVAEYDESMHFGKGGGLQSEQEEIEVLEFRFEDLPQLLQNGTIIDAKTIILLQWALLNLL
ncbi:MAG: NUDIX domain-containing protein [Saprospiraceae bacterium]|nr:MAG: NUDIX hydrolase [Bacteroidetes bacterium OLB9]MCO6463021.1 NUDIX domain-containing protein [Saprospiraceae bacterium]MCZ2337555.1 NUDIX domain-containing protein [Chitinophagales bacterium]